MIAKKTTTQGSTSASEFAQRAKVRSRGIVRECLGYMMEYKAWWLAPIFVALLLLGVLVLVGGTAAGPWIYTLF